MEQGVVPSNESTTPKPNKPGTGRPTFRKPPPPPVVAYEQTVAACGHPEQFGLFEERKDRFRSDRLKKGSVRGMLYARVGDSPLKVSISRAREEKSSRRCSQRHFRTQRRNSAIQATA
jgi:hypothetical protein